MAISKKTQTSSTPKPAKKSGNSSAGNRRGQSAGKPKALDEASETLWHTCLVLTSRALDCDADAAATRREEWMKKALAASAASVPQAATTAPAPEQAATVPPQAATDIPAHRPSPAGAAAPADRPASHPYNAIATASQPIQDTRDVEMDVIVKPEGEAGSNYTLKDECRVVDQDEWNEFHEAVRQSALESGIDIKKTFRDQCPEAVLNTCRRVVSKQPYFHKARFPGFWPIKEALKATIKQRRARKSRKLRAQIQG